MADITLSVQIEGLTNEHLKTIEDEVWTVLASKFPKLEIFTEEIERNEDGVDEDEE